MDRNTVFTKTAKGITQVNQRSASLSKDLMKVLKIIDGKSNFGQLVEKAEIDKMVLEKALNTLVKDGFARIFETRKEEPDPFAAEGGDDFDFTAPNKLPGSTQRVSAAAANDISALVRQEEERKEKEKAHEQARLKAKAEAESRAKLEAEARARQQAEQAAMEQARKAKEASERARAELDAKMRAEEQRKREVAEQAARLAAEQKVKEEAEQKRLAEMRAKAEREANERSRAEMQARLREEEAKQKALLEQQARTAAELKAREEVESQRLAELRARAEAEAKALAEARARAEAEAAAMAKARAAAEEAAKRQAEQASNAEAQMKARLKEEIEARIRQEMEELLRNEVEEKTRAQMHAEIMAEAKLAAKAELEERLREEREAIAKAEAEARVRAEQDAKRRSEEDSRKRAEAEARAQAESVARVKAEEESRRLRAEAEVVAQRAREAEARAKIEAEARAREQAEVNVKLEAERRAKIEAQARAEVEAEQREKQARELVGQIDVERKAREEAEMRARIESKARETIAEDTRVKVQAELEADMEKRAEIEGKAQAKAYMSAKAKAEEDEDQRLRDEQARKAREIATILRTKVEPDEDFAPESPTAPRKRYKKRNIVKPVIFGIVASLVIAVGLLHVVPLRKYTDKVEQALSAWLHDDVAIASMTFRLVPTPHLRLESVQVGKLLDAKAATGRVNLDLFSLFGEKIAIDSIELENVTIGAEAVRRIPTWGTVEGKSAVGLNSVRLRGIKMETKPALDPFDATLRFGKDGRMQTAALVGPHWTLNLKPADKGMEFTLGVRGWQLPVGYPIPVSDATLKGTWDGATQVVVPEFEADAMEGKVNGTLKVDWSQGWKLESDLAVARINAKDLVSTFTKDISLNGKLDGNFNFASEGPSIEQIFKASRTQGKFKVGEGSISNVDLVAVMQSDAAGSRAGVTKFAELTGEMGGQDQRASFRNLSLQGGVLRANGGVEVGLNSALTGRLNLEIRSQVAQDRGTFGVSGTVARPIVKRGG